MYMPSSSFQQSSESEEAQNGVQPAKRRRIGSQKFEPTSSTMSSEEFGMYSGYDADMNQNDPNMLNMQQELEVKCDNSDDTDPECMDGYVSWEVAASRVTRIQNELCEVRRELVELYAENKRLQIKLTAMLGG